MKKILIAALVPLFALSLGFTAVFSAGWFNVDENKNNNIVITGPSVDEIESLKAEYTASDTVYPSTNINDLKPDLKVTAILQDAKEIIISEEKYKLTGELNVGSSVITVTYWNSSLNTTFDVNVAEPSVIKIDAVYEQGTTAVNPRTYIDSLKSGLTVTAAFEDESTCLLEDEKYSLSGSLEEGISTITVTYENVTDTFDVNVTPLSIISARVNVEAELPNGYNAEDIEFKIDDESTVTEGITTSGNKVVFKTKGSYYAYSTCGAVAKYNVEPFKILESDWSISNELIKEGEAQTVATVAAGKTDNEFTINFTAGLRPAVKLDLAPLYAYCIPNGLTNIRVTVTEHTVEHEGICFEVCDGLLGFNGGGGWFAGRIYPESSTGTYEFDLQKAYDGDETGRNPANHPLEGSYDYLAIHLLAYDLGGGNYVGATGSITLKVEFLNPAMEGNSIRAYMPAKLPSGYAFADLQFRTEDGLEELNVSAVGNDNVMFSTPGTYYAYADGVLVAKYNVEPFKILESDWSISNELIKEGEAQTVATVAAGKTDNEFTINFTAGLRPAVKLDLAPLYAYCIPNGLTNIRVTVTEHTVEHEGICFEVCDGLLGFNGGGGWFAGRIYPESSTGTYEFDLQKAYDGDETGRNPANHPLEGSYDYLAIHLLAYDLGGGNYVGATGSITLKVEFLSPETSV